MSIQFAFTLLCFFLAGLISGSFLNVVIYRLPRKKSPAKGGSICPACGHPIRWYDNIPLVSFLILRGRCRDCGHRISPRYPAVELITGLLFVLVFLFEQSAKPDLLIELRALLNLIAYIYFAAMLVTISFIDAEWHIIPDKITLPSFIVGAVLLLAADPSSWINILAGALLGGGSLMLIFFLAPLVFKKQGMGFGDVKLGFVLGVFLGWNVVLALFLASLMGTFFGLTMIALKKRKWQERFAFGPCLAAGALVTYFFGGPIINWYLSLFKM